MIYLWEIPDDYPEELIGVYDKTKSPNRFLLKQGKPVKIDEVHFRLHANASKLRKLDDIANNAMVPLVSPRVAEVLSRLALDQVQLVPARIVTLDEDILEYKVVVATRQVKGIDHEVSEYVYVTGTTSIMSFKKLRYKDDCLGALHIARDAEYFSNLLVSEVLRNALEELAPHGIGLYRPEAMSW